MTTATSTYTVTRSHTATHLSNAICGAIVEILSTLGMSASSLANRWGAVYEPAIRAWIIEGTLAAIVVQCHQPGGAVAPILEFPIEYSNDGSGSLSHRHIALARLWAKLSPVPTGTTFKVICTYQGLPSDQHGWESTTRASTAGLVPNSLGTLAGGPHATASVRYYTVGA
jgi:hypothetical protein